MPCIIIDNLNACFDEKTHKWTGLRADIEWKEIDELMDLMLRFRSRVYGCTATAAHWRIDGQDGVNYDKEAANVRDWAKQKGIATWTGKEFWYDLASC